MADIFDLVYDKKTIKELEEIHEDLRKKWNESKSHKDRLMYSRYMNRIRRAQLEKE